MLENRLDSTTKNTENGELKTLVEDSLSFMKRAMGFVPTNFEYLKIWSIAREVREQEDNALESMRLQIRAGASGSGIFKDSRESSFGQLEVINRFFLREYGINIGEFHMTDDMAYEESFKKYLRILQKRHTEGEDEQSKITPHDN